MFPRPTAEGQKCPRVNLSQASVWSLTVRADFLLGLVLAGVARGHLCCWARWGARVGRHREDVSTGVRGMFSSPPEAEVRGSSHPLPQLLPETGNTSLAMFYF